MRQGNSELTAINSEQTAISWWRAILEAVRGGGIDHFPRIQQRNAMRHMETEEIISQISAVLKSIDHTQSEGQSVDRILGLTRESLDEVKELTEYQDAKATRLLTLLTFISALAAVVFGKFIDAFPFKEAVAHIDISNWPNILVLLGYLGFALFAAFAVSGTLVTFHAIRTRFKYKVKVGGSGPKSFLFYEGMLAASPKAWAESFADMDDVAQPRIRDLHWMYLKNYITESYLVAAKAADKLRFLAAAQTMQAWSIKALMLFFLTAALADVVMEPTAREDPLKELANAIEALVDKTGEMGASDGVGPASPSTKSQQPTEAGGVTSLDVV
jgi:hypothetical protein